MKEIAKNFERGMNKMQEDIERESATLKLLENSLENSNKRHNMIIRFLVAIIIILLAINAYFAYMFTTTTVIETATEQEGVYNFVDSEGNVISSDLSLEEMQELIDINGQNQENN